MADTRIDELRRRLERDPGSRLFAQLAEELRKSGDLAEAIRVARAGLGVHPVYASARLTLGRALLDSGDGSGARAELESAVRDAPDNIQASRYLAQARELVGDLKGASDQYRKTLLMAPEDRQLQAALAGVEARLNAAGGDAGVAAETTPPATRRAPPPLPARAAGPAAAPQTPGRGTAAAVPPTSAPPSAPRAGAPPVVLQPSRPVAFAVAPQQASDASSEDEELPPTLRIRASQDRATPPPPPPAPPAPPAPAAPPPPPPASAAPQLGATAAAAPAVPLVLEAPELRTLPGTPAHAPAVETGAARPGGSPMPLSSSTLAELYFQQGLVDRAVDVYRQLLEQEPHNEKARQRLSELERAIPALDDRAARRRALERTIAGLETLLVAVRRR